MKNPFIIIAFFLLYDTILVGQLLYLKYMLFTRWGLLLQ